MIAVQPVGFQLPAGQDNVALTADWVDESFFETLAIPILRGRGFRATDSADAPAVAVVTQGIAEHYWPGKDPIGQRFRLDSSLGPLVEIVGLAKPNNFLQYETSSNDFIYFPFIQASKQRPMAVYVQSSADPRGLSQPLRDAVRALDANLPTQGEFTLQALYDAIGRYLRAITQTIGALGAVGIALALTGLYGLITYEVNTRTREIGIRMALCANRSSVIRMVMRKAFLLAVSGIAAGLLLSLAVGQVIDALTPDKHPGDDDLSNGAYAILLLAVWAVTMLAAYLPARRAARVDPNAALRCE